MQQSLYGTWRLAVYNNKELFVATNSAEIYLGTNKNSLVITSDDILANELRSEYSFTKVKRH